MNIQTTAKFIFLKDYIIYTINAGTHTHIMISTLGFTYLGNTPQPVC